eukprot:1539939-Prymnesium_polylepis.1
MIEHSAHGDAHAREAVARAVANRRPAAVRWALEGGTTVDVRPRSARRTVYRHAVLRARLNVEARNVATVPRIVLGDDPTDTVLRAQVHLHPARAVTGARHWRPRGRSVEHANAAAAR